MLKKCFLYVRGFMRMSTLVILLILLVTFYFYGAKIREVANPWIEQSKKDGIIFYATGIWDKMEGVQKLTDEKNQRALELFDKTKTVADKPGLYSLGVPQEWKATLEQGAVGSQVSKTIIESPAFSQRTIASDIFYDDGAQLTIRVVKGEQPNTKLADGGYGKGLIRKTPISIGGEAGAYYVITDPAVKSGEIIEAPVIHAGNTYVLRFVYNKERYTDGEYSFSEMLDSLKFTQ